MNWSISLSVLINTLFSTSTIATLSVYQRPSYQQLQILNSQSVITFSINDCKSPSVFCLLDCCLNMINRVCNSNLIIDSPTVYTYNHSALSQLYLLSRNHFSLACNYITTCPGQQQRTTTRVFPSDRPHIKLEQPVTITWFHRYQASQALAFHMGFR